MNRGEKVRVEGLQLQLQVCRCRQVSQVRGTKAWVEETPCIFYFWCCLALAHHSAACPGWGSRRDNVRIITIDGTWSFGDETEKGYSDTVTAIP